MALGGRTEGFQTLGRQRGAHGFTLLHPLDEGEQPGRKGDAHHPGPAQHDVEHGVCTGEASAEEIVALQLHADPVQPRLEDLPQPRLLLFVPGEEEGNELLVEFARHEGEHLKVPSPTVFIAGSKRPGLTGEPVEDGDVLREQRAIVEIIDGMGHIIADAVAGAVADQVSTLIEKLPPR